MNDGSVLAGRAVSGWATGVGSLPYTDARQAASTVFDELPDLPHVPELPGRGVAAGMVARGCSILVDLHVDLQPAGWRLVAGESADERRARSLWGEDLDAVEEVAHAYTGPLKVQVAGPFTLASTVERPRGGLVLADHAARRDLGQSLAAGVAEHVVEIRRRVPGAQVVVQIDEPRLADVLEGSVPTASGFSRHRAVGQAEARTVLAEVVAEITGAGAQPVFHSCGDIALVELFTAVGAAGVSFDATRVRRADVDVLSAVVEQRVLLFVGAVPVVDPMDGSLPTDGDVTRSVLRLWRSLGFAGADAAARCVITPTCGLAGSSPHGARAALSLSRRAGACLAEEGATAD